MTNIRQCIYRYVRIIFLFLTPLSLYECSIRLKMVGISHHPSWPIQPTLRQSNIAIVCNDVCVHTYISRYSTMDQRNVEAPEWGKEKRLLKMAQNAVLALLLTNNLLSLHAIKWKRKGMIKGTNESTKFLFVFFLISLSLSLCSLYSFVRSFVLQSICFLFSQSFMYSCMCVVFEATTFRSTRLGCVIWQLRVQVCVLHAPRSLHMKSLSFDCNYPICVCVRVCGLFSYETDSAALARMFTQVIPFSHFPLRLLECSFPISSYLFFFPDFLSLFFLTFRAFYFHLVALLCHFTLCMCYYFFSYDTSEKKYEWHTWYRIWNTLDSPLSLCVYYFLCRHNSTSCAPAGAGALTLPSSSYSSSYFLFFILIFYMLRFFFFLSFVLLLFASFSLHTFFSNIFMHIGRCNGFPCELFISMQK